MSLVKYFSRSPVTSMFYSLFFCLGVFQDMYPLLLKHHYQTQELNNLKNLFVKGTLERSYTSRSEITVVTWEQIRFNSKIPG